MTDENGRGVPFFGATFLRASKKGGWLESHFTLRFELSSRNSIIGIMSLLDNLSIVLVHTRTPANIGSVARCMMNMGLSRLILVRPPKDPDGEAMKLAAGADAIIARAPVFGALEEAVADHQLVIGTSRHSGRLRKNVQEPREAALQASRLLPQNRVAVVFGNEVNGLDRSELALCQEIIQVPSSPAFPSLNLSHAVMIVAYEFFLACRTGSNAEPCSLADMKNLEAFFDHLQQTLAAAGFFKEQEPDRIMFSLRQLYGRARLDEREVSILRGILTSIAGCTANDKPKN